MRMEVHSANNPSYNALITQQQQQQEQQQQQNSITLSRSNSPISIEKVIEDLGLISPLDGSGSVSLGAEVDNKSNGSLSGASTASATGIASLAILTNGTATSTAAISPVGSGGGGGGGSGSTAGTTGNASSTSTGIKKRISSSRTPTRKARRIKFYRNGDRFYPGITIPVSNERYRSFESLFEDLTRLLEDNVKIPGAVRAIYTMCGKKISNLDELEDGQSYVCSCNNENFKKIEYNTASQPLANLSVSTKASNRLSKLIRPSSPLKNGISSGPGTNGSPVTLRLMGRDSVVHPRIVTLIRNGTKPRKIIRLLLNKRNSPSFDHVLTAITQVVRLDTGYVRKVFTLSGSPVVQLADFFGSDDIFFAYGTERVNNPDDFKLEADEQKAIQAIRKNLRTAGPAFQGPKPKMPVKSKNLHNVAYDCIEDAMLNESGIDASELPPVIRERYALGIERSCP